MLWNTLPAEVQATIMGEARNKAMELREYLDTFPVRVRRADDGTWSIELKPKGKNNE